MAQHKASLEKTLQSAFKHKKAGTEVATTILAIEALVASGIDTTAIVENTDEKVTGRTRAACAHKSFGKRLADSIATLDAIIALEAIVVVAADVTIAGSGAPHKQNLRRVMIGAMSRRDVGLKVADMVSEVEPVVDELLVIYGVGGAKDDVPTAAALTLIKAALA
jgi:hypothetical protein